MDEFFNHPILPIIETTRGCPFSCAFCADGNASKNIVHRYDSQRVKDELNYIAKRVKNVNELHLADLNFGMYTRYIYCKNDCGHPSEIWFSKNNKCSWW